MKITIDEQTYILTGLEWMALNSASKHKATLAELREKLISVFSQSEGDTVTIVPSKAKEVMPTAVRDY